MTELQKHRIVESRVRRCRNRFPRLVGRNSSRDPQGYGFNFHLTEIRTDLGAYGWGICEGSFANAPSLAGKLVSDVFDPKVGITGPEFKAFDFSLHDLAGKILNQSAVALLSGGSPAGRGPVAAYDGAIYMDDIAVDGSAGSIEKVIDNCRYDFDAGYRDFKLKVGRGHKWIPGTSGLQRDIDVTRAVRRHFPDARILVDGNDGFTVDTAIEYIKAVADCKVFWFEEPFRENREDLLRLREVIARHTPTTFIADGEFRPNVDEMLKLAAEGLVDVLLMDVNELGFTGWRKIMPAVNATKARISPHAWGVSLKTCYAAQMALAFGRADVVEGVIDQVEGVDTSKFRFANGLIHVPDSPGNGLDLIYAPPV